LQNFFCFGNPAVPVGPVAFPALPFQASGPPTNFSGRASSDYSEFGFIGKLFFIYYLVLVKSKFNAKYNKMVKPIDLYMGLSNMNF
jgi:hypothetical protein